MKASKTPAARAAPKPPAKRAGGTRTGAKKSAVAKRPAPRTRLDPAVREKMILDAAVEFFAEHGFAGQTKELAARIGVSQGLIFRYFDTKQTLVERVYERVFLERWSPLWERELKDRAVAFPARMERFYRAYLDAVDAEQWMRVAMFASLAGHDITNRYIQTHIEPVLEIILKEANAYCGRPDDGPVGPLDREHAWHLHSAFIYYLVRKHIHRLPVLEDKAALVTRLVTAFIAGYAALPATSPAAEAPGREPAPQKSRPRRPVSRKAAARKASTGG